MHLLNSISALQNLKVWKKKKNFSLFLLLQFKAQKKHIQDIRRFKHDTLCIEIYFYKKQWKNMRSSKQAPWKELKTGKTTVLKRDLIY